MLNLSLAEAADTGPAGHQTAALQARAKRVILLFMNGGVSHVDTFDPKPMLEKYDGQPTLAVRSSPSANGNLMKSRSSSRSTARAASIERPLAELGTVADDICVVRSMYADIPNHEPSLTMWNTARTSSAARRWALDHLRSRDDKR